MKPRLPRFKRCGHAPGALTPEDAAAIDDFRAMLTALKNPRPWSPGSGADAAVRVGPFIERAYPRPGDDHGPDLIAVALARPDTPHAAAYTHRYTSTGWLRCDTSTILGAGLPSPPSRAAGLDLLAETGMTPAHYSVHIEARHPDGTGCTLLRLGPYTPVSPRRPRRRPPSTPTWKERRTRSRPRPRCGRPPPRSTSTTTPPTATRTRPTPSYF